MRLWRLSCCRLAWISIRGSYSFLFFYYLVFRIFLIQRGHFFLLFFLLSLVDLPGVKSRPPFTFISVRGASSFNASTTCCWELRMRTWTDPSARSSRSTITFPPIPRVWSLLNLDVFFASYTDDLVAERVPGVSFVVKMINTIVSLSTQLSDLTRP